MIFGPASAQQVASQEPVARSYFDPSIVGDQVFQLGEKIIFQRLMTVDEFRSLLGQSAEVPETLRPPQSLAGTYLWSPSWSCP